MPHPVAGIQVRNPINAVVSDLPPSDSRHIYGGIDVTLVDIRPYWRNRKIFDYRTGFTPARSLDLLHDKVGRVCRAVLQQDDSEFLEQAIRDHAYRRMQISYGQFVAYWNEGCSVGRGKTSHQHGVAECGSCQAAHDALIANLEDDFFDVLVVEIHKNGITPETEAKLVAMEMTENQIERIKRLRMDPSRIAAILQEVPGDGFDRLISDQCHLYHVMNATMRLPTEVNRVDCLLEAQLRPYLITLLNEGSLEGTHPYELFSKLAVAIWQFFDSAILTTEKKQALLEQQIAADQTLCRLEQQLQCGEPVDPVSFIHEYFDAACRMKRLEEEMKELNGFSPPLNLKATIGPFDQYLTQLSDQAADVDPNLVLADPRTVRTALREIKRRIQITGPWPAHDWQPVRCRLADAKQIMQLQYEGTLLPDYALLSGKVTPQGRVPMTDDELVQQKLEFISRRYDVTYS